MVKNLLILKNELVSLEIGDITNAGDSLQHFSQIWETLSPQNWIAFFGNMMGGSLWSRSSAPTVTAKTLTVEDMSEQLDELLRQSIYAFTKRWGALITSARGGKAGAQSLDKVETALEEVLHVAFSNQPEVVGKLKEAIQLNVQAQDDANDSKQGVRRY